MKGKINRIFGSSQRPRLRVSVSLKNIYAQVIDDIKGNTLACASTVDKELKDRSSLKANIASAKLVGDLVGKRSIAAGIENVVFDRGKKKYHGRVKAVADSARAAGLKF
jgi:large subunit ribosomal protein L18